MLDTTGRILGIMPHPERAADATLGSDDGLAIFKAARAWFERAFNRHTESSMFAASETIDVTDAKKLAADFGLSDREYTHVEKTLGRVPTRTELGVFAGMWSEHCSYKSTLHWLKTLPKDGGEYALAGPACMLASSM